MPCRTNFIDDNRLSNTAGCTKRIITTVCFLSVWSEPILQGPKTADLSNLYVLFIFDGCSFTSVQVKGIQYKEAPLTLTASFMGLMRTENKDQEVHIFCLCTPYKFPSEALFDGVTVWQYQFNYNLIFSSTDFYFDIFIHLLRHHCQTWQKEMSDNEILKYLYIYKYYIITI